MIFSCDKKPLLEAFSAAAQTTTAKSSIQVLEGVKVQANPDNTVSFIGYNLKTAVSTIMDANVKEPGEVVIPARIFCSIVNAFDNGLVLVTSGFDHINVKCGTAAYSIVGYITRDYPDLPETGDNVLENVPISTLHPMVQNSAFAVSTDESRPVFCGMLLEFCDGELVTCAVDGYRLAVHRAHGFANTKNLSDEKVSFIIPGEMLKVLLKVFPTVGDSSDINIALNSRFIRFDCGNTSVISNRIVGEFFDYNSALKTDCTYAVTVEKTPLVSALKRVGIATDAKNKTPVVCSFSKDDIELSCKSQTATAKEVADYADSVVDLSEPFSVAFNHVYLYDALSSASTDKVVLHLKDKNSPVFITPEGADDDFTFMVMPVRMRGGES